MKRATSIPIRVPSLLWIAAATLSGCPSSVASPNEPTPAPERSVEAGEVVLGQAARAWIDTGVVMAEPFAPEVQAPARFALRDGAVVDVTTPVRGRALVVHVLPGDIVTEGTPIVSIESPEAVAMRAELAAAGAELAAARDALRRHERMLRAGVGVELESAEAAARHAQAKTGFERARRAVELIGEGDGPEVIVRAPVHGTVLTRAVVKGAMVGPESGPLLQIGDPENVWLIAEVLERDLADVVIGGRARVTTTSGEVLAARVTRIGSVVDASTRRAPVFLELAEGEPRLRAGTWARVLLQGDARVAVVLPVEAVLVKERGRSVVYIEQEGRFREREVTVGARAGARVEIVEGLAVSDTVVQRGALLLDGQASLLL